jgi:hypothetical protein
MFSGTAQVSHQVCSFFVSSVCLLVHVTMVDKNKAVVYCLLATSAIMLSEKKKRKRKMCSGIWKGIYHAMLICWMNCLKQMCLEMMPSWCRQLNWGNCGIPSELRSSLCERWLKRTVLRPVLLPVKTAQFTHFFPSGMTSHSKKDQFNWECIGHLRVMYYSIFFSYCYAPDLRCIFMLHIGT